MTRALGLVFGLFACAGIAGAQSARVLVLVEETHDGSRASAGAGESKLQGELLKAGYALVERYDAEQARSKVSIDRMLHGDTAGLEVTGLHADVLIAARISVEKEEAPYGITTAVHRARIELKALAVDTGRIFYTETAQAATPGDAGAASAKVALQIAPALIDAMKKGLEKREVLEVRVSGLKEAKAADALAAQLGKVAGVKWAKVRYVSADATMIDVAAPGMDPQKLEAALASAHLTVSRRSANVVEARLDETAVARRSVAVAAFANKSGRPDLDWLSALLADVFETELVNSRYLAPSTAAGHPKIDPDKPSASGVATDIVVVGKYDKVGGTKLRLVAKAIDAKGTLLATAEHFDEESKLAEIGKEVVWKLDEKLYQKLVGHSSLEGYVSPPGRKIAVGESRGAQASAAGGAKLRIEEVKLGDLFPARIGWYAENPLGTVALRNDGPEQHDVKVEISLGELTGGPQIVRVGAIGAGKRVEVPLKLVLERKQLLEVSQRRPARADLAVLAGGDRQAFTEPLVLWDRNAIDWNVTDSVAAFVTPKDPVVRSFADAALKMESLLPGSLPSGVRAAAALFDAILSLGVRYQKDPLAPYGAQAIDTVQFPRETLARRAGDCDDLSTLYASLLQAAGQDARLVLTPGHIFVAVSTGVPFARAGERLGGAAKAVNLDGTAWIPVEVTRLDGGFAAAWQAGADELGRYGSKAQYVNVPQAWRSYPSFPLDAPGQAPAIVAARAKKLLADDGKALGDTAQASLPAQPASAAKPEEKLAYAAAMAERGDDGAAGLLQAIIDDREAPTAVRGRAANDLGNFMTIGKRYKDAARSYESALRNGVDKSSVEHNLGVAWYNAGDGNEARKHFQKSGTDEDKQLLKKLGLALREPAKKTTPPKVGVPSVATGKTPTTVDNSASDEGIRAGRELDPRDALIWLGRK